MDMDKSTSCFLIAPCLTQVKILTSAHKMPFDALSNGVEIIMSKLLQKMQYESTLRGKKVGISQSLA
jgi:hypothetical protein